MTDKTLLIQLPGNQTLAVVRASGYLFDCRQSSFPARQRVKGKNPAPIPGELSGLGNEGPGEQEVARPLITLFSAFS